MQLKILTLLFCCAVFGAVSVRAAQLRLMNAQLASLVNIGITTNRYQNGTLSVMSRVNPVYLDIPATSYISLPTPSIPLNTNIQFTAYNADSAQLPVVSKAQINATLQSDSSYTLVYVDQSETLWRGVASFPAPRLLLFKDHSIGSGFKVKFVNIAVSSYPSSELLVYFAGTRYNLTFGSQSAEIPVTPGLTYELLVSNNYLGNQTVQFTPIKNATTVIYFRGDYYYPMTLGYNIVTINSQGVLAEPPLPVTAPVAYNPNVQPIKIRLINGYALNTNLTMTIYDTGVPLFSFGSVFGPYQTLVAGSGAYYVSIGDMYGGEMFNTYITLTAGTTYSYLIGSSAAGVLLDDSVAMDNSTTYLRIINSIPSINVTSVLYQSPVEPFYRSWQLFTGETTFFFPCVSGSVSVKLNSQSWIEQSNYTLAPGTVTTVVALGDKEYFELFADSQPLTPPTPIAAPYSSSAPTVPVTPTAPTTPIAAQIALYNSLPFNVTLTVWDNGVLRQSAGLFGGYYDYIYSSGILYAEVSTEGTLMYRTYLNVTLGKIYSYFVCSYSNGFLLEEKPNPYVVNKAYIRVLDCLQQNSSSTVTLTLPDNNYVYELRNSDITDFVDVQTVALYYTVSINNQGETTNYTSQLVNSTAVTIFLSGDDYSTAIRPVGASLFNQVLTWPDCFGYYNYTTRNCICRAGQYTTSYLRQCEAIAPDYCFVNVTSKLDNDVAPYVNWWEPQVNGNRLSLNVYSQMVRWRYTAIELPNPACNQADSPQYYYKSVSGCTDVLYMNIPFTECGFVKTSTQYEDVYKGTINVKQIDPWIQVGNLYPFDRVINTPLPISIRMPKTLAVSSDVQMFGPPTLAIDAAFVGQTVSTQTQSGNLQYTSSVQYPLAIESIEVVDLPYGVTAWVELVNVNCSMPGVPCLQRLEIHLNTSSCTISGVYRLALSIGCRSDVGCPDEAKNGTQVYLESRVVSQNLCSEVSVDIDLNGYIQAYTDSNFVSQALAFYPGQSAYFLLTAYSSRVSLSSVTLSSLYYYGPNIGYQYLYYDNNVTNQAQSNNFTWGSLGTSQAWFGIDVTVNTPQSSDNSLFKLYQGQNAVYNFVAYVDVEWSVQSNSTNAPTSFKKRMALQGSGNNQNSQFTAQVQIAGPTPSAQQSPVQQQQTPVDTSAGPKDGKVSYSNTISFVGLPIFVTLIALFV